LRDTFAKAAQLQKQLRLSPVLKDSDELTLSHKMQDKELKIYFQAGKMNPVNPMARLIETWFCGQNQS